MGTEIASLGIEIDSSPVGRAKQYLDELTAAGDKTEQGIKRLTMAQTALNFQLAAAKDKAEQTAKIETRNAATAALVNRIQDQIAAEKQAEVTASAMGDKIDSLLMKYASWTVVIATATSLLKQMWVAGHEATEVALRMDIALRNVGATSGRTTDQLNRLAESLSATTRFDDTAIKQGMTTMLKFSSVHSDTFDKAIQVTSKYAEMSGHSFQASAQQIGRALEAIASGRGTGGLRGLEEQFGKLTSTQRNYIDELVKLGETTKAQNYLLDIMSGKLGDVDTEMAGAGVNAVSMFKKAWKELMEELGKPPAEGGALDWLIKKGTESINNWTRILKPGGLEAFGAGVRRNQLQNIVGNESLSADRRESARAELGAMNDAAISAQKEHDIAENQKRVDAELAAWLAAQTRSDELKAEVWKKGATKRAADEKALQAATLADHLADVAIAAASEKAVYATWLTEVQELHREGLASDSQYYDAQKAALTLQFSVKQAEYGKQLALLTNYDNKTDKDVVETQKKIDKVWADKLASEQAYTAQSDLLAQKRAYDADKPQRDAQAATEKEIEAINDSTEALRRKNDAFTLVGDTYKVLPASITNATIAQLEQNATDLAFLDNSESVVDGINRRIAALKQLATEQTREVANEKISADFKRQADYFKGLWDTVERTGKDVFVHLFADGKNAFEGIGKALKASVIDLLYQLTARKWLIQIGAGVSTSLGMAAADAATQQAAGSFLGSGASSLMSGLGLANLPSIGSAIGNFGTAISTFSTMVGEGSTAAGAFSAAAAGMGPSLMAVAPYVGVALMAANALGLFGGGGGGPPPGFRAPNSVKLSDAGGKFAVVQASEVPDPAAMMALAKSVNAALNDPKQFNQEVLKRSAGTIFTGAAGTGSADLITGLLQKLAPAAAVANAQRQMEIQLMELQGADLTALNMRRQDELKAMDPALRAQAQNIYEWQDVVKMQATMKQKDELDLQLMELTGNAASALASRRLQELDAADPLLRATMKQIYAAQDLAQATNDAAAAEQAAQSEVDAARADVFNAYDTEKGNLQSLADSMSGFGKSLRDLQQGLLLGANSPLTPMQQFDAAQSNFRSLVARAKLGDQTALASLSSGAAGQDYLTTGRGAYSSSSQFTNIFNEVQSAYGLAAATADRTASNAVQQIAYMSQQVDHLAGIRAGVVSLNAAMAALSVKIATQTQVVADMTWRTQLQQRAA